MPPERFDKCLLIGYATHSYWIRHAAIQATLGTTLVYRRVRLFFGLHVSRPGLGAIFPFRTSNAKPTEWISCFSAGVSEKNQRRQSRRYGVAPEICQWRRHRHQRPYCRQCRFRCLWPAGGYGIQPKTIFIGREATPIVLAHPKQIEQVVINLLQNAMDALGSETGNICIRIGCVKIDADLPTSPVGAVEQIGEPHPIGTRAGRLTISDTGRGIDRQVIARIWERFYTTKEINLGSGLGLSVVLGIVKSHGGTILLESAPGRGTTFSVLLPLHETNNYQM